MSGIVTGRKRAGQDTRRSRCQRSLCAGCGICNVGVPAFFVLARTAHTGPSSTLGQAAIAARIDDIRDNGDIRQWVTSRAADHAEIDRTSRVKNAESISDACSHASCCWAELEKHDDQKQTQNENGWGFRYLHFRNCSDGSCSSRAQAQVDGSWRWANRPRRTGKASAVHEHEARCRIILDHCNRLLGFQLDPAARFSAE